MENKKCSKPPTSQKKYFKIFQRTKWSHEYWLLPVQPGFIGGVERSHWPCCWHAKDPSTVDTSTPLSLMIDAFLFLLICRYMGVSRNGGTPIAGWFKNGTSYKNEGDLGVPPFMETLICSFILQRIEPWGIMIAPSILSNITPLESWTKQTLRISTDTNYSIFFDGKLWQLPTTPCFFGGLLWFNPMDFFPNFATFFSSCAARLLWTRWWYKPNHSMGGDTCRYAVYLYLCR